MTPAPSEKVKTQSCARRATLLSGAVVRRRASFLNVHLAGVGGGGFGLFCMDWDIAKIAGFFVLDGFSGVDS